MSLLFTPMRVGNVEVKNRFVHSATFEGMAEETGKVTERLIKRYRQLARGEVGLIIPGALYVHPLGRVNRFQTGIFSDEMIPGLQKLVDTVHDDGGKIAFQLVHAGRQTSKDVIGQNPMGPSSYRRDPVYMVKPREMTEADIEETIKAFGSAARRAVETGVDGIQLHAAHGILINQFLSPFYNHRKDKWGGSDENRFRYLKEVVLEVKESVPEGMPVMVKLSSNDYTPREGITPPLAAKYAGWLVDIGIDGVEISAGTGSYSNMNIWRGEVPVKELVSGLPSWKKPLGWIVLKMMEGNYDLVEGYNLDAAKTIKPALGDVPLFLVGGLRRVDHMEEILEKGHAEFLSMSRPFIREPNLVKRFKEGKSEAATCISCNKCLAATVNDERVRCFYHPGKEQK